MTATLIWVTVQKSLGTTGLDDHSSTSIGKDDQESSASIYAILYSQSP